MNDTIPSLKIERMDDGIGDGLILLEQEDNSGNVDRVAIHPIHLHYMAEKFGLVENSDPHARKTIATLTRRLRLLRDRIASPPRCGSTHRRTRTTSISSSPTH